MFYSLDNARRNVRGEEAFVPWGEYIHRSRNWEKWEKLRSMGRCAGTCRVEKRATDPGKDTQTLMKIEIGPEGALKRHLVNFHYNEYPTIHSSRKRYENLL